MSLLIKAVNEMKTGIENVTVGVGHGVRCPLHMVGKHNQMDALAKNVAENSGKACPAVGECRDVFAGIA